MTTTSVPRISLTIRGRSRIDLRRERVGRLSQWCSSRMLPQRSSDSRSPAVSVASRQRGRVRVIEGQANRHIRDAGRHRSFGRLAQLVRARASHALRLNGRMSEAVGSIQLLVCALCFVSGPLAAFCAREATKRATQIEAVVAVEPYSPESRPPGAAPDRWK